MRWPLAFVLLAGCDRVFQLDPLPDARPIGPACVASCECDPFDFSILDTARWDTFTSGGIRVTQADELKVDLTEIPNHQGNAYGGARLLGDWDLTGATVTIEIPQVIGGSTMQTESYLRLSSPGDVTHAYHIHYLGGTIRFTTRVESPFAHEARPYDASRDRWWRISNKLEPDRVVFETRASEDEQWVMAAEAASQVSFAEMQIHLIVGSFGTGDPDPGIATFDNFALCGATRIR